MYTWLVYEFSNGGRRGDHLRKKGERVMRSGTRNEEWRDTRTEEKGIGRGRAANELKCKYDAIVRPGPLFTKNRYSTLHSSNYNHVHKNIYTHIMQGGGRRDYHGKETRVR